MAIMPPAHKRLVHHATAKGFARLPTPGWNKFLDQGSYDHRVRRRDDPEPSYEGQRAGIFNRLVDEQRVGLMNAENWLRAWEARAEEIGFPRGVQGFWAEGWGWIVRELALERRGSD